MSTYTWPSNGSGIQTYATFSAFPASAPNGTLALALDTDFLYAYNTTSMMWVQIGAGGSGTVTSVSVISANGLAGTVATATTTPAITLSTTITGILQGNGTAISAASTTGSGAVVLATSPTLVTPALGTPSALVLTNATGLPLTSGVTGILPIANGGTNASSAASAFVNLSPLTTAGDLIYENSVPAPARLAIGSAGQILTVSGGLPIWSAPATSGTVTSVSVVSANGLAGTVATATSTPAITLSTTITGILQGNGTAISAATVGNLTDVGTDGIVITGGTGAVLGSGTSIAQQVANTSQNGYLASTDWNTFNNKQPAGSYITALTGDVVATGPGSVASTIQPNVVTNAKLAQMAANTIKGNNTGSTANALDLTATQVTAMLNPFTGDTGSGGLQGLVLAPPSGSKAAGDFLSANGSWAYVDQSKPIYTDFSLINQTVNVTSGARLDNIVLYTGLNGKNYAVTLGNAASTLGIYDVTDEALPVLCSNTALAGAYNVSIANISGATYIFVGSNGSHTLYIVNVTNPYSPVITTTFTLAGSPGSLYGIVYNAGYAYIATQSLGLTVLDVGGGASGGTLLAPVQSYQEAGGVKSFGVAIANGTLFTTQYTTSTFTTRQIKSWSIATPQTPSPIQSVQVTTAGEALGITISGNTAFVSVIATGVNSIDLIDITTPSAMTNLSQIAATNLMGSGFVAVGSGNYVFVPSGSNATYGGSIDLYDITNRASPIKVASAFSNVATSVFGPIALGSGYIFVADYGTAGGSSSLDIFTMPQLNIVAGNVLTSTLTMVTGATNGYVLTSNAFGNASWAAPATSGTVTSVSVVSANGLAGTVATATTTPAITLSTTITGILQGNGTAISAASTTGSGAVVLATSPTLVTPALGTPSALVLTNATGLPLTSGVSGILPIANGGTNASSAAIAFANLSPLVNAGDLIYENATPAPANLAIGSTGQVLTVVGGLPAWASPATSGTVTSVSVVSANGLAGTVATATTTPAITLSTTITGILQGNGTAISAASTTGSGAVVLATSPTLVTPSLGTPSALVLTNATGLPLTSGVSGILPIANGGTNASSAASAFVNLSPLTTAGDLIYENATPAPARLPIGSTGNVLTVSGGLPTWAAPASSGTVTSVSVVSSNGFAGTVATATTTPAITLSTSITGILQGNGTAISAASTTGSGNVVLATSPTLVTPALGTPSALVLTNATGLPVAGGGTGDASFTAYSVICGGTTSTGALQNVSGVGSSGQVLTSNGASALPTWQAAGAGSFTAPTIQKFTSGSGTYTTPTSPAPLYIRVEMVGGGGGGGSSGGSSSGSGGNSSFGTSLLLAGGGGGGGTGGAAGGSGGTASLGSGPIGIALSGGNGGGTTVGIGTSGAVSPFGGAGGGGQPSLAGSAAVPNTGSGGGGGGLSTGAGSGGGASGYVNAIITSPSSTYTYSVGSAGAVNGSGTLGGAGGSGIIIVTEYYQ